MKQIITEHEKETVYKVLRAAFVAKCNGRDFLTTCLKFSKKQVAWYSGLTITKVENILQEMVRNDLIEFHSHQGTSAKKSYTKFIFTDKFPYNHYSTKRLSKQIKEDAYLKQFWKNKN
jgi:hypothetical protein